jgi:hypothetical protein
MRLGAMTFKGDTALGPQAQLTIEIAGSTPVEEVDQLLVRGALRLDGTLIVQLAEDFQPRVGDRSPIVECLAREGRFARVMGLEVDERASLIVHSVPDGVILEVVESSAAGAVPPA